MFASGSIWKLILGASPGATVAPTLIMIALSCDALAQHSPGGSDTGPLAAGAASPDKRRTMSCPTCTPVPKATWPLLGSGVPWASPMT